MHQIQYAFAVFLRIFSVLVTGPAVVFFLIFGVSYHFSFEAAARDVYLAAEELVRDGRGAHAGYLAIRKCEDPDNTGTVIKPAVSCETPTLRYVRIEALAAQSGQTLATAYWLLVALGFAANIAAFGPRRFFMMESEAQSEKGSRSHIGR